MNRKTGIILSYVFMIFEVLSTLLLTPFIIRTLGKRNMVYISLLPALMPICCCLIWVLGMP